MSNELYYRGSEEYAVAVKNQLERMEIQGIRDANKIAFSVQNMEYGIRSDIRQSTYAIVASQEMLRQTFQQGFDSVNNTLQLGFGMMAERLAGIENAVYQVGEEICNKLDEIHDIVNNPLLTASRELYRRALKNYQNGYFSEALEDIKQAVEKNKTDYISWELMGEIYLYGAGKFSNVINLDEAEKAFENAAKYIDADLSSMKEANTQKMLNDDKEEWAKFNYNLNFKNFAAKIFFELGYTRLLKSNDLLVGGNEAESIEMLAKSTANLEDSFKKKSIPVDVMSPKNFDSYIRNLERNDSAKDEPRWQKEIEKQSYDTFCYCKILTNLAKDKHFQGKDDEALDLISKAIDADSNNALIFSTDKDFESLWSKIENLVEEKRKFLISKIEEERNKVSKLEFTQEKMNFVLSEYDAIIFGYKDVPFLSLVEIIRNPKRLNFYSDKEYEIIKEKELIKGLIRTLDSFPQPTDWQLSRYSLVIDPGKVYLHADLKDINDKNIDCSQEIASYLSRIKSSQSFSSKAAEHTRDYATSFQVLLECIKDDLDNQAKTYNLEEIKKLSDSLANYIGILSKTIEKNLKTGHRVRTGCLIFVIIWVIIGFIGAYLSGEL